MPAILANTQQFNIVLIFAANTIPFDFSVYSAKVSLASPSDLYAKSLALSGCSAQVRSAALDLRILSLHN